MEARRYPQFILFGDSIIQFSSYLNDGFSFGAGLQEHCIRRLDIINRGLSGYNTAHAMKILPEVIPSPSCAQVEYLLIMFGANDSSLPDSPTHQHVPLEKYKQNIRAMITHSSVMAHSPTILLVTPPPLDEIRLLVGDLASGYPSVTRRSSVTAEYATAIRDIAVEFRENVVLIDLWTAIMNEAIALTPGYVAERALLGSEEKGERGGLEDLLVDGLHLTGIGYKVFLNEVLPVVGRICQEEPADNISWVFPPWRVAPKTE